MTFENIYLLYILLVPFSLFAFLVLTNKDALERVFKKRVLKRISVEDSGVSSRVRNATTLASIFFMIIAIANPYIDRGERNLRVSSLEVTIVLDISGSMRCKDRYPNRLEFAKLKIEELLYKLSDDDIMLLAFSKNTYLASPMSDDKDTLKEVIHGISKEYLQGESNFETLASVLKNKLKSRSKIVVIVSDGAQSNELINFKKVIKSEGIKLYAILIGTKDGSPVLDSKDKTVFNGGKIVISKLNMSLANVAKESGGDYIIADYGAENMESIAKKIDSNMHNSIKSSSIKVRDKQVLFYYPLIVSILLLLIAISSMPSYSKRDKK